MLISVSDFHDDLGVKVDAIEYSKTKVWYETWTQSDGGKE